MAVVDMAKRIKVVHPEHLLMYKIGTFYKVFGKDSYIISSVFGYKYNLVDENVPCCGFPVSSINKIRSKLEDMQVNYMMLDPRNNYDVDYEESFNNLNQYNKVFEKSYSRVKNMKKINRISEELIMLMDRPNFKDIVRSVEDVLDENGKI